MRIAVYTAEAMGVLLLYLASLSDYKTRTVSDRYTLGIVLTALVKYLLLFLYGVPEAILPGVICGASVFIASLSVTVITGKGGGADIKLPAATALLMDMPRFLCVLLFYVLLLLFYQSYKACSLHIKLKEAIRSPVPCIPFLFGGVIVSQIFF